MRDTDNWEMEAIHEQFDVFNSLTTPSEIITVQGIYRVPIGWKILNSVLEVMEKHLQLSNAYATSLYTENTEKVVNTVLKLSEVSKEKVLTFSFVVIVTDQIVSKGMCKMPIFIVTLGDISVFIDIYNKMFKSWDAFIQGNSLPVCKFCFPVNGRYNVGGKLKVDFASSAAALTLLSQSPVKTSIFSGCWGKIVDYTTVAASFLYTIAPICFKLVTDLTPTALRFISQLYTRKRDFLVLSGLIAAFRTGVTPTLDVMLSACKVLMSLSEFVLTLVKTEWVHVKRIFQEAYCKLSSKFPKLFSSASPSSQHEFLAITQGVDSETEHNKREAERIISAATKVISGPDFADQDNSVYCQRIFQNSINECALQKKHSEPFGEVTTEILDVTKKIADDQQITTLLDLKNTFLSVKANVFEEYIDKVNNYSKYMKAAADAAKGEFDIDAFNESYGIKGDPKDHFMQEALQSYRRSLRFKLKVKEKTNDLKDYSKIVLIPLCKKHSNDDIAGAYKFIGVRGTGKCSATALLGALEEQFGNLTKGTVNRNTLDNMTAIYSEGFAVLFVEEVNEENTSEGVVFVDTWH